MVALSTIRQTIATALNAVDGLQAYDYVPPQVNTPAAVVAPDSITYDVEFEHSATYRFPVQILVALGDWESAQRQLDAMVSHDGTAVVAINTADIEAQVVAMSDYGLTPYGDKNFLGAVLVVEVFT